MAYIILGAPGEDATAGAPGQRDFVFGTIGGDEVISIMHGGDVTLDASFNRGHDLIRLPGGAGNYGAELSGSRIILSSEDGTRVSIPLGTVATMLSFDGDDNLELVVIDGVVHIGGQPLEDGEVMPSPSPGLALTQPSVLGGQGLEMLGEDGFDEVGLRASDASEVNSDGSADVAVGNGSLNITGEGSSSGASLSAAEVFNDDGYTAFLVDVLPGSVSAAYLIYGSEWDWG